MRRPREVVKVVLRCVAAGRELGVGEACIKRLGCVSLVLGCKPHREFGGAIDGREGREEVSCCSCKVGVPGGRRGGRVARAENLCGGETRDEDYDGVGVEHMKRSQEEIRTIYTFHSAAAMESQFFGSTKLTTPVS